MKYGMIPSPLDPITDWFYKNREVIVIFVGGAVVITGLSAGFIWFADNVVPKLDMSSGEAILLIMLLMTNRSCNCKCSK